MIKNTDFLLSLSVESFLVSNYFQRYVLAQFVIVAFYNLAKASLAQDLQYFEPVVNVIMLHRFKTTIFVVIAVVVWASNNTYKEQRNSVDFRFSA